MGDIIEFKGKKNPVSNDTSDPKATVLDITDLRVQQIQQDRRDAKRTILDGFIGVSVVIPGRGLLRVNLFDISKGGLAFDMKVEAGHFHEGEEIAVRFYFNHNGYFPFVIRISSCRIFEEEGYSRHGATFVSELSNMSVLTYFVEFIEAVSSNLKHDNGDLFINDYGG